MRWTRYDSRTAARAALATVVMLGMAWLVTASTDEGGLSWAVRAGRVLPLAPACGALGTWLALARARARGELHALEGLGRSPWQGARPAVSGAAAIALSCAVVVLAVRSIDVQGFFPGAPHTAEYRYADGGFVDGADRVRIEPDGAITPLPGAAVRARQIPARAPRAGRLAAALALAFAGLAFPLASARIEPRTTARRRSGNGARVGLALAGTVGGSILLFHLAAAGRAPALLAALPPLVLLAAAAFRYGGDSSWQKTRG